MHKKSALSLTLMVCLLAPALPVTAQEKTEWTAGPLSRAITREAVRLAVARELTRPDVGAVQKGGKFERPDWSESAAFTTQAQPGQRPGWFKRHTVLGCSLIGAAIGTTWASLATREAPRPKPGEPWAPGFSTAGADVPFGFIYGAGAGALVGVLVVLSR